MAAQGEDLIRVVHYPGSPLDLGVVVGFFTEAGKRAYNVLWHDGAGDVVDRLGRLGEMHDFRRVVTVSRRRSHCRRVNEWGEASLAAFLLEETWTEERLSTLDAEAGR